jgi:hypothetical protein
VLVFQFIGSIIFGKFHKGKGAVVEMKVLKHCIDQLFIVHVCNLKEFKVLGGMSPTKMTELVHSGM